MKNFFLLCFFALSSFSAYTNEVVIGYSVNKKPIYLYKYGDGKELILVIAGIHGNERNTEETAKLLLKKLNGNEIIIPEGKSLWVIPSANPDGIARGRRLNDNNVDLNRNFKTDGWKSSFMFFNAKLSAGKTPFSEPETKALRELFNKIKNNFKIAVLSLHSAGNAVVPGSLDYYNENLTNFVMKNSNYLTNTVGYDTFGDLTRWLSDKFRIASVTIEFENKKDTDLENVERIVLSLLKSEFSEAVYKNQSDLFALFKNSDDKDIESLIKGLPENIKDNIKSSDENKKIFLENYKKLSDMEDLIPLVNKTHKLPADYVPEDLVELKNNFPANRIDFSLRKKILPDLKKMFEDAASDGAQLRIISAYRSYETQKRVFNGWTAKFGEKEARRVSAEPGASQHQLGTAIDFNALDENFEKSREGRWLYENSYKYGFILSFPKGLEEFTGFKYEPWHYRYVGKEASLLIYRFFDNSLELFLNWYWDKKDNNF